MSKYATLAEIKQHLRYDDDSNDLILTGFLAGAETLIDNYITDPVTDTMLPVLKVATLLLVGNLDDYRNAEKDTPDNGNYLPMPVQRLLYAYRTPTAMFGVTDESQ